MSTDAPQRTALAVIGAGPGGYAAAFRAADLGLQVTLIDRAAVPGGVCLREGCIPSKALLHVARLREEAAEAAACGLAFLPPQLDLPKLRGWKNGIVEKLTSGLRLLSAQRNVTFIPAEATRREARSVRLMLPDGGEKRIEADQVILATGSSPITLAAPAAGSCSALDAAAALALETIPGDLLVIGGGYIGLELGSVYAALGSRVTLVEMTDQLLPGVDRDLVRVLERRLVGRFARVRLSTRVEDMAEKSDGRLVTFAAPDGARETQRFDAVLTAVGRRPNSSGSLMSGVTLDSRGFVQVDEARRTNLPGVFAIGDLTGNPMLAHKATAEGLVAAEAAAGRAAAFQPRALPAVVFTDPEIAWCGLTETAAAAARLPVKVARWPWSASGRALAMGRGDGLTKLIGDPASGRLLGAAVCGPGAGELIAEAALALELGAGVEDLARVIHPHPTLSETLREAAEVYLGRSVHAPRPRRQ